MNVLVAPDKFKGSLSAAAAARAMALGVRRALPGTGVRTLALADGGEGTVDALLQARGGRRVPLVASGPLGDPVEAGLALLDDGRAALEVAAASGLSLVQVHGRDALRASSAGTGRLLAAALDAAGPEVVVGVGGSASTDGGTGAASVLGWRFLDARGRALEPGGGALVRLARIDGDRVDRRLQATRVVAACDVAIGLLGPAGAARAFAPQKGATVEQVERLEEGLARLVERIRVDLGADVADRRGAGAGGGLGAGLAAFFGAELLPGFELVAREAGLERLLESAAFVVTGEGRLDRHSLDGKVPVGVAHAARAHEVACLAVAGSIELPGEVLRQHGFSAVASLVDEVGENTALADPAASLAQVTEALVRRALPG